MVSHHRQKEFEDAGLSRLHLVDLDGAKAGAIQNLKVLEEIATATKLQIDFGGGVKKEQDIKEIYKAFPKLKFIHFINKKCKMAGYIGG